MYPRSDEMYRRNVRLDDPAHRGRFFFEDLDDMLQSCRYIIRFIALVSLLFLAAWAVIKMPTPPKICQMQWAYGKITLHAKGSEEYIFATELGPNATDEILAVAKKINCPVVP